MSTWKIHEHTKYYFATSTITEWYPVFTNHNYYALIIESLKFCVDNKGLHIHAYVIMLNHLHLILSADKNSDISDIMRDFKTYTSREITKLLKRDNNLVTLGIFAKAALNDRRKNHFKVWQEGFHPIVIDSESFFLQKLNYIHQNPVRKGYVSEPEHWLYSSARNYALMTDYPLEVECLFR